MEGSPLISPSTSYASSRDLLEKGQKYAEEDIEELIDTYNETKTNIAKSIELIEYLDLSVSITAYKIYEATHEFKSKITEIKTQREKLLSSLENRSELSLILNDLDKRILELQEELDFKIKYLNQQKIAFQEEIEATVNQLDVELKNLKDTFDYLKSSINVDEQIPYQTQIKLINEKYAPRIVEFERDVLDFTKLQMSNWKLVHSEERLSGLLEEQGLKITPSGYLLTRTGSRITFEEAQMRGYFQHIKDSMEKVFNFFKERENQLPPPTLESLSEASTSIASTMTSEEVKYLKRTVGKVLTLALAEITVKQPRDPIHYLGHYLFKYRYNQEVELIDKQKTEELMKERKAVASERWHRFVEEEAKAAVIDMVLKAEAMAMENELKRIEAEQLLLQEEEENLDTLDPTLIEEARDKFE